MLINAEDILAQYPVKTGVQRQKFLEDIQAYAQALGYPVYIEKGPFGCSNLVIGNAQQAKFYVSAGSALSGVAAWLEIFRTFPENQRHKVCFLLLDGKSGASFFRKNHAAETDNRLVIELNHVGDGDHLRIYPTKQLRENKVRLTSLYRACGYFGVRDLLLAEGKRPVLLKLGSCFPYEATICALQSRKKRFCYNYKTRNTALDNTNVNILRAALTTFLCCDEVN